MAHVLGYIPARLGSERVKAKNLRLLNGQPLIAYAIASCRTVRSVDRFVVNTESPEIAEVARQHGMDSYRRDPQLAKPDTMTDDIVVDFLSENPCDAVVVVNPTAPFLTAATIDAAVERFLQRRPSALFTTNTLRKHAFLQGRPVNFDGTGKSPRTQDLTPVSLVNFIVCVFDAGHALRSFAATGSFLYSGSTEFMEMPESESFDIDTELDFHLAERAMTMERAPAAYHPVLADLSRNLP